MALPDSFLEELRYRNDIDDVISRYVGLKKSGGRAVGLCPFHTEKTPSFTIFSETQSFYCFGCGAGGDIITFIRRIENLDYIDAVRLLAQQSGLTVPQDSNVDEKTHKLRETVLKMNKEAARYFHERLCAQEGAEGMSYLEKRKLSKSVIIRFGLGYAPKGWDNLLNHLVSLGYNKEDIKSAGLAIKNDKGGYYDRFRGRVMFPIIDVRGNVIGFGGRVLDDSQPKYLNSPDSVVFKKSLNLFSLNLAKNHNDDRLILAEGYMDVISLHQAGFSNAVASLGTSLTAEQARLMSRYAKDVVIAYDSDEAGQKAAKRAIALLTPTGLNVKVLNIAGGKDPDDYIKTYGADKFRRLMDGSGNHIVYLVERAKEKYDLNLSEDKVAFLKEAAGILARLSSAVEREVYIDKISEEVQIEKNAIKKEIELINKKLNRGNSKKEFNEIMSKLTGLKDKVNPDKHKHLKAARAEEGLIAILLKHPDYFDKIAERITAHDFVTEFNRRVFNIISERLEEQKDIEIIDLSAYLSPEEMGRVVGYSANAVYAKDELMQADEYIKEIMYEKDRLDQESIKDIAAEELNKYVKEKLAARKK